MAATITKLGEARIKNNEVELYTITHDGSDTSATFTSGRAVKGVIGVTSFAQSGTTVTATFAAGTNTQTSTIMVLF